MRLFSVVTLGPNLGTVSEFCGYYYYYFFFFEGVLFIRQQYSCFLFLM